jgi:hypothetical protein
MKCHDNVPYAKNANRRRGIGFPVRQSSLTRQTHINFADRTKQNTLVVYVHLDT